MAGVLLHFRHICGFWVHQWNLRVKDMPPIAKVCHQNIYSTRSYIADLPGVYQLT